MSGVLPAATGIGRIMLRVANLERSLEFYCGMLGMVEHNRVTARADVGPRGGSVLITLIEVPRTLHRPQGLPGLYHLALLFPRRRELGVLLLHMFQSHWPFQGFADHAVSEAAYLADPDGNGIELYADRPKDDWERRGDEIVMTTLTLNVNSLIRTAEGEEWNGAHPRTVVGHLHFHVTDLGAAEHFFHEVIGFDVTTRSYPGALFLSAGGYHHHVGCNTWLKSYPGNQNDVAGLLGYELRVPEQSAATALVARAQAAGIKVEAGGGGAFKLPDLNGAEVTISS